MPRTELTIERNALISLMLALVLTGVLVWMNVIGVERISNNTAQVVRVDGVVDALHGLSQRLVDVEAGEHGYLITGDDAFLAPYRLGLPRVNGKRDDLHHLLAGDASVANSLSELDRLLDARLLMAQANIQMRKSGLDAAHARAMVDSGKRETDALRAMLDELATAQYNRKIELRMQRQEMLNEQERYIAVAAVVTVSLLLYLHFRLVRLMKFRHEAETQMRHLATHDVLTGLPNRRLMLEHIDQAMQRSIRHQKGMALLFLDLNGFKPVNDQYGHKAGDEVLKQIAQRLSDVMRASDRVARLGGDEFVVLAEEVADKEDVCGIVGKIDAEINRPFRLKEGAEVTLSTSIGVAVYPRDGEDMETLLRVADTAMYEAKRSASNCFCKEQKQLRRCVLRSEGEEK